MARCPKCSGEMHPKAVVCPHCGYDFPAPAERRYVPLWRLVLIALATGAATVLLHNNPVWQVVVGVCGVLFWLGVFFDVQRFLRGD
jgi:hypothetical protein